MLRVPSPQHKQTPADLMSRLVVNFNKARQRAGLPTFDANKKPIDIFQPPMFPPGLKLRDHKMPFDGGEFYALMGGVDPRAEAAALRLMWRSWTERPTGDLAERRPSAAPVVGYRQREGVGKAPTGCPSTLRQVLGRAMALPPSVRACRGHRARACSQTAVGWLQFAKWFADRSKAYAENGTSTGRSDLPTRPNSFLPSIKQSVLMPRARLTDPTPTPTPTRPKDARQDHEHEGQVEMALPDDWRPSAGDIEAVRAARPDLDEIALERQRVRFVRRASGTATQAEWSRRFVGFAKNGRGKAVVGTATGVGIDCAGRDQRAAARAR